MLNDEYSENSIDEESSESALSTIPEESESGGKTETDGDADPLPVSVLPHDEFIFSEVGHIIHGENGFQSEEEPADVGVEKALRNIIGIIIVIHVFMVSSVITAPFEA